MVIALAALMAGASFIILTRLLWLSAKPRNADGQPRSSEGRRNPSTTIITVAAAALVIGLGVLAATGKLHWLAAVGAALIPFVRRAFGLLRYLPWARQAFNAYQGTKNHAAGGSTASRATGEMDVAQAREILGLGTHPTRDEVISAHKRLMQKVHPDRGGSTFLAQQLNEAKVTLLRAL